MRRETYSREREEDEMIKRLLSGLHLIPTKVICAERREEKKTQGKGSCGAAKGERKAERATIRFFLFNRKSSSVNSVHCTR